MTIDIKKTLGNLTENEIKLLPVLFQSSKDNGHDFGFTEDARDVFPDPKTHPGVLASLQAKGIIDIGDPVETDSGWWTQFNFGSSMEPDKAVIEAVEGYLEREQDQREAMKLTAEAAGKGSAGPITETVKDPKFDPMIPATVNGVSVESTERTQAEPALHKFTIRVERVVTEFIEVKVEARDLGEAANLAENEARKGVTPLLAIHEWKRIDESPVIKASDVVYPVVPVAEPGPKADQFPFETRCLVRSENPTLLIGRLVHNNLGWIFFSNVSSHTNGRTRRAVMEQAIPAWARKGIKIIKGSEFARMNRLIKGS